MTTELAVLDAAAVERAADPGEFVVQACEQGKYWLDKALEVGDIDQIVEIKSRAEAIRVYTVQIGAAKDAQLAAAELVRRGERGLGVAVKRGQDNREIKTPREGSGRPRKIESESDSIRQRPRALDFFKNDEERTAGYSMAETSEDDFEEAIQEARADGNLSRANVVRKAAQKRLINVPDKAGSARPEILRKTRRVDPDRVVQSTVDAALHLSAGYPELYDFAALDGERIPGWVSSLEESIRFLTTLKRRLNKELTRD